MRRSARKLLGATAFSFVIAGLGASGCGDKSTDSNTSQSSTSRTTPTTVSTPGTLALSATSYAIAQNAGSLTVSVMRTGGASGAASVSYATAVGSAVAGTDYGNTSGTLSWTDGDAASKSFSVPILNGTPFTGSRTLSVQLSGALGASLGAPATATVTIDGDAVAAVPEVTKSISEWVSCSGTSDDTAGVQQAFAAASHGAFTLIVDCPVNLIVGMDIARSVFIDDGTTVEFTGNGQITTDNVFIPAFVIANSTNITLTNWSVLYNASLPVNPAIGGYVLDGKFISNSHAQPGNAFNDVRLTNWLIANRGLVFDSSQGTVKSAWGGTTNECAMFLISGDSSNVSVSGMQVSVPAGAGGDRFVPVVFSMNSNFKSNQTVNAATPVNSQYYAIPHDLSFTDIELDGTYMGWVGMAHDAKFQNIRSARYGDLQDANGGTVGGVGKWFAPPHLFYLSYSAVTDSALLNANIQISNVADNGPRIGVARDKGGSDSISGYALSLKISCISCSVDTYTSNRVDGFLDVLASSGLSISNVTATYDSSFLNNMYPGWRFPSQPYKNVSFTNISLTDSAVSSVKQPIGDASQWSNDALVFTNVQVGLTQWHGPNALPLPAIAGTANTVSLNYMIANDKLRIVRSQNDALVATLEATPATLSAGGTTTLTWSSQDAQGCAASGAWSGSLPKSGSRSVTVGPAGRYGFSITCANDSNPSNPATAVVVAN